MIVGLTASSARAAARTTTYEMVAGRAVTVSAWCAVCSAPRGCDVLRGSHKAIPDFLICLHCGNGVAVGDEEALAA